MRTGGHAQRRFSLWHGAAVLVVLVTVIALVLIHSAIGDNPWEDGEERGRFRSVYHGYGTVTGDDDEIVLQPQSAKDSSVTHGALVVTRDSFDKADFTVLMTTEEQVRKGPPNEWEVGWTLWNYTDDDHFYAVALKPNGWEISKQDPAYPGKQRFLATGTGPTFPIGESHLVSVSQEDGEMVVRVDGDVLATVVDEETPYTRGSIGFYTEDARVRFEDLNLTAGS